jgi:hypothetical protein
MHDTNSNSKPVRFHCRHIFTDGLRCGSFCLRGEEFCYYHHNSRRPVPIQEIQHRKLHREEFVLPNLEDRSAIQATISEVLQRIAANEIDPRRAGLLLYGLQIASLNLPKPDPTAKPAKMVEEVVVDPTFGAIAPRCERHKKPRKKSVTEQLLEDLDREFPDDPIDQIQAKAEEKTGNWKLETGNRTHQPVRHNRRTRRRKLATRSS